MKRLIWLLLFLFIPSIAFCETVQLQPSNAIAPDKTTSVSGTGEAVVVLDATKAAEAEVQLVVNEYLNLVTTPPQSDMNQAMGVIKSLAALFDLPNLSGSPAMEEFAAQYSQLLAQETNSPSKKQLIISMVQGTFFGNYLSAFQKARIDKFGACKREDFSLGRISFTNELQQAVATIKDQLGLAKLGLHKKDNNWLIYSVENPQ